MGIIRHLLPYINDSGVLSLVKSIAGLMLYLSPVMIASVKKTANNRSVMLMNMAFLLVLNVIAWLAAGALLAERIMLIVFVLNALVFWLFPLILAIRAKSVNKKGFHL